MNIRISGLMNDSIVDGKGLRFAIYVQGCSHRCKGCHNPQTHDFNGGKLMDIETIWQEIQENPLLDGLTFSGGEPMEQPLPLISLAERAKEMGLNLWSYSGYTYEELLQANDDKTRLLKTLDVLVDGRFVEEERTLSLPFRGSKNQRIIDVQKSIKSNSIVLLEL